MNIRQTVYDWDRFGTSRPTERQFKAACAWIDGVGSLDRLLTANRLQVQALIDSYRGGKP